MKRFVWTQLDVREREEVLGRPEQRADAALQASVRAIVEDVRARGWPAAVEHSLRLDGAVPRLMPVAALAEDARRALSSEQISALNLAYANVTAFHEGAVPADHEVCTMPGVRIARTWRPLDRVGLYIPGGKVPLFSTLLMLAIPARAAGVREIAVVTPPRADGGLDPLIALAAQLCGIEAVWTIGGVQAIAALGFGAGDIPRVSKICGPGNAYVNEAKTLLASLPGGPAIDMPAGPSELMVIAEASADARLVAADLLSQAEHDRSAQVLLVTSSADLAEAVADQLAEQSVSLPRREIVQASLAFARTIIVDSLNIAVEVANLYAPEHLSLAIDDPEILVPMVRNAGAIFAGHRAAETFGDYLSGPSHVLPTDGAARAWSGVSVHTFLKSVSVQRISLEGSHGLAAPAAALARLEGLEAHARAADARLERAFA